MDLQHTLKTLCAANGPSGFEGPAVRVAAELLRPLADEVSIDRLGSVVGIRRCGKDGAKRLMLDAHLDEIGLLVTKVEEGFLRFRTLGGVDARMLANREVTILSDPPRYGVVAWLPPHLRPAAEREKAVPVDELYIDTGLTQEQAEEAIPAGTPMVFRGSCATLGEGQVCGKALDNRAGFAILLRTMELLSGAKLDVDIYIVGSTFEECGASASGAGTAAFTIRPDCAVVVDVTFGQSPDSPKEGTFQLGGGPVVGIGPNMNRRLTQRLICKAKELDIPYQLEVMAGPSGTNAHALQVARDGVATAILSPPLKYMHSPIEVLDLADIEQTAELLAAFVRGLGEEEIGC